MTIALWVRSDLVCPCSTQLSSGNSGFRLVGAAGVTVVACGEKSSFRAEVDFMQERAYIADDDNKLLARLGLLLLLHYLQCFTSIIADLGMLRTTDNDKTRQDTAAVLCTFSTMIGNRSLKCAVVAMQNCNSRIYEIPMQPAR